jgi:hypothetical protein
MCKGAAATCRGNLLLIDKDDKIIYNYPESGPLLEARGLFLTLAQLFSDMFDSAPSRYTHFKIFVFFLTYLYSTQISFDNIPYLVLYLSDENHILMLAIPIDK